MHIFIEILHRNWCEGAAVRTTVSLCEGILWGNPAKRNRSFFSAAQHLYVPRSTTFTNNLCIVCSWNFNLFPVKICTLVIVHSEAYRN